MRVSKRELAEVLGVSERSLTDWQTEAGFPVVELAELRGQENIYETSVVIAWYVQREVLKVGESDSARRRLLTAQAARAELDLARARGELVSAADIARVATSTSREVRNSMFAIPDRLAPSLAAERSPEVIHKLLTGEIKNALSALCERFDREAEAALAEGDR